METREFLLQARLDSEALEAWIAAGWLFPRRASEERRFAEIDVARARLIRDLQDNCGVNEEGVGVVLDLLDQVHNLRRVLRNVLSAVNAQPEEMRQTIVAQISTLTSSRDEDR
ncbi:MAG TPA: chaperone modulator CbpM [Xanthobacteraceae bacterium]|jgi:chaperone modulatory protein CbpM